MKSDALKCAEAFFGTELPDEKKQNLGKATLHDWIIALDYGCKLLDFGVDCIRWIFLDGSSVICAGNSWDFGIPGCDCFCWASKGHASNCPECTPEKTCDTYLENLKAVAARLRECSDYIVNHRKELSPETVAQCKDALDDILDLVAGKKAVLSMIIEDQSEL